MRYFLGSFPTPKMSQLENIHARFAAQAPSQKMLRAVELLGDAQLVQRLAGLALLRATPLGFQSEEQSAWREVVEDILCAFVRARTRFLPGLTPPKLEADTQAALTALGARLFEAAQPLDLHGACLREVVWPGAKLRGAFLYDCDLEGALFIGADLRDCWLWRAQLKRANLDGADLRGADASGARGLVPEQLKSAIWDETTRWPLGLTL